jgi:hypothetical protein
MMSAAITSTEKRRSICANDRAVNSVEMSHRVMHHFRHRTLIEGNDWRATGHGFNHHETEGLGPRNGNEQGKGATKAWSVASSSSSVS